MKIARNWFKMFFVMLKQWSRTSKGRESWFEIQTNHYQPQWQRCDLLFSFFLYLYLYLEIQVLPKYKSVLASVWRDSICFACTPIRDGGSSTGVARREWFFHLLIILRIWVSSGKRKRLVNKMQDNFMARACVCIPMTAVMVMVVVMRLMMVTMMQDSFLTRAVCVYPHDSESGSCPKLSAWQKWLWSRVGTSGHNRKHHQRLHQHQHHPRRQRLLLLPTSSVTNVINASVINVFIIKLNNHSSSFLSQICDFLTGPPSLGWNMIALWREHGVKWT